MWATGVTAFSEKALYGGCREITSITDPPVLSLHWRNNLFVVLCTGRGSRKWQGLLPGGSYHVRVTPFLIYSLTGEGVFVAVCVKELYLVCLQSDRTPRVSVTSAIKIPSNPPSGLPMATGVELAVGLSTAFVPLVFFLHSKATWSLQSLWQFIPQSEITHKECTTCKNRNRQRL